MNSTIMIQTTPKIVLASEFFHVSDYVASGSGDSVRFNLSIPRNPLPLLTFHQQQFMIALAAHMLRLCGFIIVMYQSSPKAKSLRVCAERSPRLRTFPYFGFNPVIDAIHYPSSKLPTPQSLPCGFSWEANPDSYLPGAQIKMKGDGLLFRDRPDLAIIPKWMMDVVAWQTGFHLQIPGVTVHPYDRELIAYRPSRKLTGLRMSEMPAPTVSAPLASTEEPAHDLMQNALKDFGWQLDF